MSPRTVQTYHTAYLVHSDYNFGLPSFPWVNGRDFAGIVVKAGKAASRVKIGDVVGMAVAQHRQYYSLKLCRCSAHLRIIVMLGKLHIKSIS